MKVLLRDGFGKLTDNILDLSKLKNRKQDLGGYHMIFKDQAGTVVGAIRVAYGLVLSIEADGSINTSPVSEFALDDEGNLNRVGDANRPQVISVVMPLALTAQMMSQERHPGSGPVEPTDRKGNPA